MPAGTGSGRTKLIGWSQGLRYAVLIAVCGLSIGQVAAEDCTAPCWTYAISGDLDFGLVVASQPSHLQTLELTPSIDADIAYFPRDNLKLAATITTESVLDTDEASNQVFQDLGTYLGELYVQIGEENALRIGKITPSFGVATDVLDGIHATDIVGEYDLDERIGAEGYIGFAAAGMAHRITASAFTVDRTFLSDSLFTSRGSTQLKDGGAGNSKGLSSAALLAEGCRGAETAECYDEGAFGYRFGLLFQEAGQATQEQEEDGIIPSDETGVLGAVTGRVPLHGAMLNLVGEFAFFRNFGDDPENRIFGTLAAEIDQGPMSYMAALSIERQLNGAEQTAQLVDLTARYAFGRDALEIGDAWALSAGYSFARNLEGETSHTVSLQLTLDLESNGDGTAPEELDNLISISGAD